MNDFDLDGCVTPLCRRVVSTCHVSASPDPAMGLCVTGSYRSTLYLVDIVSVQKTYCSPICNTRLFAYYVFCCVSW